jgi:hypothetical protein
MLGFCLPGRPCPLRRIDEKALHQLLFFPLGMTFVVIDPFKRQGLIFKTRRMRAGECRQHSTIAVCRKSAGIRSRMWLHVAHY